MMHEFELYKLTTDIKFLAFNYFFLLAFIISLFTCVRFVFNVLCYVFLLLFVCLCRYRHGEIKFICININDIDSILAA